MFSVSIVVFKYDISSYVTIHSSIEKVKSKIKSFIIESFDGDGDENIKQKYIKQLKTLKKLKDIHELCDEVTDNISEREENKISITIEKVRCDE